MNPKWNHLVAIALTLVLAYRYRDKLPIDIDPTPPAPSPVIPAPSVDLQTAVAPVRAMLSGHADAAKLAELWTIVANRLTATNSTIETVGQLIDFNRTAGSIVFTDKAGPAGLREQVEAIVKAQLGAQEAPLDRAKAAAVFRALAWAATSNESALARWNAEGVVDPLVWKGSTMRSATGEYSQSQLGKMFGIAQPTVSNIITGSRWKTEKFIDRIREAV